MKDPAGNRLNLALQASNEGVWEWYVGEPDIYYSERANRFLGYEGGDAPNIITKAAECFHPDDFPEYQESLQRMLSPNGLEKLAIECRYQHQDKTWHWLRVRGVAVRDNKGNVQRIVGTIIDITERKVTETELEEERHRLYQLIENIPVNVYYKDEDSKFVLANSSTAHKMGVESYEDLLGKSDHDFFDITHANIARANELEIMESRKPQIQIIQRETWEGKEDTWAEISKMPWLDKKGNLVGTLGITSDVTDLIRTQRMLASVAEELQSRYTAVDEELKLARQIQQALLPRSLGGLTLEAYSRKVTFGCRYTPASEMAGDFYEVLPISEHAFGFLVCDVMGHGVRAALVVSMLRGLMEKEREVAIDPESYLYGINEGLVAILQRAGVTFFATAIYCVVNLKEGTLSYSCAGHPSPIVVRSGVASQFGEDGNSKNPALGLIPGSTFSAKSVSLNNMDRLFIFTDGLHEVEDTAGRQLGIKQVEYMLTENKESALEETLDHVLDKARAYSENGEFSDDVCLLAMDVISNL